MNTKKMCKLLLEGDNYFKDENVDTQKFNKNEKIKGYCSSNGCKTNEDRIHAVAKYIIMNFKMLIIRKTQYNNYDEYLLMWIGDKLLKIHKKGKGKNIRKGYMDAFTLKQAYEEYLDKHKKGLDYWDLLNMMQGLKEANLKYMSEFYKLLNHICKLITYYETKGVESREFSRNSIGCSRQYKILYNNISDCQSYLDLLNKLKGTYDDFSSVIKKNSSNINLATKLKKLTLENGKEMDAVRGFKTYDFSTEQCKFPIKQKKIVSSKKAEPSGLPPSSKEEPPPQQQKQDSPSPQEPQRETQQLSSAKPPEDLPTKLELPSSSQESQELGKNNQNELTDPGKETGGSKSETKGPEVEKGNMKGRDKELGDPSGGKDSQINGGDRANSESGGEDTGKGGPEGGSTDKISETGDLDNGKGASKGGTGDVLGGDQKSPDGTSDLGSGAGGTSGGSGSDTDNQGGDTGGDKESQNGSGNSGSVSGGAPGSSGRESKDNTQTKTNQVGDSPSMPQIPGSENKGTKQGAVNQDQDSNSKKGVPGGTGNPVNVPDDGQGSGQDNQRITSSESGGADGGPDASKIGQKTSDSDKGNKDGGGNGGAGTPGSGVNEGGSVQGDQGKSSDKTGRGSDGHANKGSQGDSENQVNTGNQTKQSGNLPHGNSASLPSGTDTTPIPSPPVQPPSTPTPPPSPSDSTPPSPSDSPSDSLKDAPKDSQPNSSPTTSIDPTSKNQPSPQSQSITLSPQQVDQPNHKTNVQLVKSPSSDHVFIRPWNIIPTTWNGSEDCKPKIKFMSTTLVCCTSKQCSLTGVSVTLILIPIILLIAYKCLSIGSSKKSEKKNMKRVIKLVDGNRKTKIIISSNDRIKHLKPVINSVGGKKNSLLNIYKIIQGDPMPFINLFFLLIFFVYKRKRDTIE
ncbi:CIR protein PIR protein [Plasmodium vinckei vinckei]|uniref:CIR protein PIR protein n=1 Tax=Plasmodium vinckei vinckei TaxID=54757 RepID=A0A449BNX5_PLAVN|nr:CIR protein PIR protein [Plasmodium vinckei vinckei]VEV55113.1 CIR protein PIR protein [Plasmodium vinckei vinckei]